MSEGQYQPFVDPPGGTLFVRSRRETLLGSSQGSCEIPPLDFSHVRRVSVISSAMRKSEGRI